MKKSIMALIVSSFLCCSLSLYALEPPEYGEIEALRRSGELSARLELARRLGNHKFDTKLVQRFIGKMRAQGYTPAYAPESDAASSIGRYAPPPAWEGMPTVGSPKIFVLLIEFADYPHNSPTNDQAAITKKLFGKPTGGSLPYDNLSNFYARASYGKLDLSNGVTLGWYNTNLPRSMVTKTTAGREQLIMTALNSFNPTVDFSTFDNDGDGYIDYFGVIWSGPDSGWASFWWGYQTVWQENPSYTLDRKKLWLYSWQWESKPVGGVFNPLAMIHETGHALGLPDYYDYTKGTGPNGGVGGLDQMDNYGDHNCFSKWMLDWISPTVIASGSQRLTLKASGNSPDAVMMMPEAANSKLFSEYFMAQHRQRLQNDVQLPTDGLLIWHVDATLNAQGTDFLYDNSTTEHKLLRLMEADGLEEIETGDGKADIGDFYKTGKSFGPLTKPSSSNYQQQTTGVQVTNISSYSSYSTATFGVLLPTYTLTILKNGTGAGTISSSPIGITCGTDCSEDYTSGMTVTLTATPNATSTFAGWSGACSGVSNCIVTMSASKSVTATFTAVCQAGDMDCNGSFNIFDVQRLVNCVFGKGSCSNGDLNNDGKYNIFDVQQLVNKIFDS